MITARFKLTRRECARAGWYMTVRRRSTVIPAMIAVVIVVAGAALQSVWIWLGITYLGLSAVLMPVSVEFVARKRAKLATDATFSFSDESLSTETATGSSTVAWSHIVKLRRTGDLCLLVNRWSQYYIVPERGFASPDDVEKFVALVEERTTTA